MRDAIKEIAPYKKSVLQNLKTIAKLSFFNYFLCINYKV